MKEKIVDNLAEELKVKDKLELGKNRAMELFGLNYAPPAYDAEMVHYLLGEGLKVRGAPNHPGVCELP